jgi:hypothetical protein
MAEDKSNVAELHHYGNCPRLHNRPCHTRLTGFRGSLGTRLAIPTPRVSRLYL